MQGTPVKSCMTTRAGVNWISVSGSAAASQDAERLDLRLRDVGAVLGAQQVLEQHLEAEGELLVARDGVDAEDLVVGAADRQGALGTEAVDRGHGRLPLSSTPHPRGRRTHVPARPP